MFIMTTRPYYKLVLGICKRVTLSYKSNYLTFTFNNLYDLLRVWQPLGSSEAIIASSSSADYAASTSRPPGGRERGREGSTFLQSGAAFGVMKRRSTVSECLPASTVLRNLQTYYLGFIPPLSDQVLNLSRLTAKFHPSESKYCRSGRC